MVDDDAAVLSRSCADPDAFTVIFERHHAAIHRYVVRRLGPTPGADVAADVFVVAFRSRQRYDLRHADARPWLYGIASNLVRRHRRTEARKLRASARLARPAPEPFTADADDRLVARAAFPAVAAALARLTQRDRDVVLLHAWADLRYEEIAVALDVPVGTVRSRLHRARVQMRADLDGVVSPAPERRPGIEGAVP